MGEGGGGKVRGGCTSISPYPAALPWVDLPPSEGVSLLIVTTVVRPFRTLDYPDQDFMGHAKITFYLTWYTREREERGTR